MKITLKLLATILLVRLSCAAAPAQSKKPTPDPKKLIGHAIVDGKYPDGWRRADGDYEGLNKPYRWMQIKYKRGNAIIVIKEKFDSKDTNKPTGEIVDAIEVTKPNDPHSFSTRCYFEKDKEAVSQGRFKNWIDANVKFKNYCDMTTTSIKKAWKFHTDIGKFELIKDTKGLICEFGFGAEAYKLGWPEPRENCPSSNWYPDTLYKK